MPNRMLTKQEVHEIFMEQMRSACGQDIRKQRAYVYDWAGFLRVEPSATTILKREKP